MPDVWWEDLSTLAASPLELHASLIGPPEYELSDAMRGAVALLDEWRDVCSSTTVTETRSETSQRWYSSLPDLAVYDIQIIEIFASLTSENVAEFFPIFEGFRVNTDAGNELCLAMAAVGGLFCQVPDSFRVAKAMYNDARRLTFSKVTLFYHTKKASTIADAMVLSSMAKLIRTQGNLSTPVRQ